MGYFCCQAEDGIRDLVRSRGLGDVYKRQVRVTGRLDTRTSAHTGLTYTHVITDPIELMPPEAVSYTHLTLPTSDLV